MYDVTLLDALTADYHPSVCSGQDLNKIEMSFTTK